MLIHDAATAFTAVITAAIAWVQILAGAAAIVLCALPLCIAPGVRAVHARRAAQQARTAPHTVSRAPRATGSPERPAGGRAACRTPAWAHADHHDDYRKAA